MMSFNQSDTRKETMETLLRDRILVNEEVRVLPPPAAPLPPQCSSVAHDVVDVTRFSSETPGAAEQRRSGWIHTELQTWLLIGWSESVRRFHWTLN